jgi:hypothetical protein
MARTNSKIYEASTPTKVAFIGLGVMGYPMAGHLALAGHHVTVYNRNPAKATDWCAEFPKQASAPTPRQAAQGADMVFCCVGNDDDLRAVMLGADGALAGMKAGAVLVEAAEIDPLALAAVRLNAALNGVAVATPPGDVVGAPCRWDVIFAGDVGYEAPMTTHILPWLRGLVAAGAEVLIADPGRAYLPKAGLAPIARYSVPTTRELEDRETRDVTIHRLSA